MDVFRSRDDALPPPVAAFFAAVAGEADDYRVVAHRHADVAALQRHLHDVKAAVNRIAMLAKLVGDGYRLDDEAAQEIVALMADAARILDGEAQLLQKIYP